MAKFLITFFLLLVSLVGRANHNFLLSCKIEEYQGRPGTMKLKTYSLAVSFFDASQTENIVPRTIDWREIQGGADLDADFSVSASVSTSASKHLNFDYDEVKRVARFQSRDFFLEVYTDPSDRYFGFYPAYVEAELVTGWGDLSLDENVYCHLQRHPRTLPQPW